VPNAILDTTLVDDLVPTIDELRTLNDEFGTRQQRVFTVRRTWNGARRGEGTGQLATVDAPTATPVGITGAVAYGYKVVAKDSSGHAFPSGIGSTSSGNAVLDNSNFNTVEWVDVPNATSYDVYRTVGGSTQGLIANVAAGVQTLDDTGLAGDSTLPTNTNTSSGVGASYTDVETEILPTPRVTDMRRTILDTAGLMQEGRVQVREVSLTYSESELTGGTLADNVQWLYKLTDAHGQGQAAQYYAIGDEPPRVDREKDMGWVVTLKRAEGAEC
jgi:hypothetical protein